MLILAAVTLTLAAGEPVQSAARSATLARDIGGFALGMSIAEARQLAPLVPIGNGEFETQKDGITYNLAITTLGRIYRVTSSQDLKRFAPDHRFLADLKNKLFRRFGRATSSSSEAYSWELYEPVRRADGSRLPFKTNWVSALLSRSGQGVSLDMTMLDFRVRWSDEAKVDAVPQARAADRLRF